MFAKLLVIFAVSVQLCCGQVLLFGQCAEVETKEFFQIEKFLGEWYVVERFPIWYEDYGDCAYKRIQACGRNVRFEHWFVRDGIQFVLHVNSSYAPGAEAVFAIQASSIDPIGVPLSVIATDYSNYALLYGCKYNEELNMKYLLAWILSREKQLPPEILQQAYADLNSLPYASTAYLQKVNQDVDACPYRWTAHVEADESIINS